MNSRPKYRLSRLAAHRWLVLLSIALLLWCQSGAIFWQLARQAHYHVVRMKQQSREADTIFLSLQHAEDELVWVEPDEVRYNGRMFDIVRRIRYQDGVMLTGHYDHDDDHLFRWLSALIDDDSESPGSRRKLSFWTCDALLPGIFFLRSFPPTQGSQCTCHLADRLDAIQYSPPAPPPRSYYYC